MQPDLAQTLILHSIASHQILAYVIVFILLFLEGDAILFGIAFLAHRGFLDLGILVPLVFFGAFFSDLVWYAVGRRLDRTWPWLHVRIERVARHFDRHLTENPERTIMIAKFIYGGICRALIMRASTVIDPPFSPRQS